MKKILKHPLTLSLITFAIFYFSSLFQYIPIKLLHIRQTTIELRILLSTFSSIIVSIIFYFIYRKELLKEWEIFKKNKLECLNVGFKYWIIGFIIMITSNIIIMSFFNGNGAGNEKTVQNMVNVLPWIMLINAGIFAPFNEEITFRKDFKKVFKNKWVFALLSGFVFGFLHVAGNINTPVDLLYIIPYGSFGVTFSLAYYETDTIFTNLTYHMAHNIILMLLSIIAL